MEILNLDELAIVKKSITLDKVTYAIREMNVDDFIQSSAEAKRLEKQTESDAATDIEANIVHLHRVIPDLPAGRIRTLNFPQLTALIRFVNGQIVEAGAPASEGEAGK